MKIYTVIQQDRHVDTTATPFACFKKARAYAKECALKNCKNPEDFEEFDLPPWRYFVQYNPEGDCLWITEHDVELTMASPEEIPIVS